MGWPVGVQCFIGCVIGVRRPTGRSTDQCAQHAARTVWAGGISDAGAVPPDHVHRRTPVARGTVRRSEPWTGRAAVGVDVGLEVDDRAIGTASRTRRSAASMARATSARRVVGRDGDLRGDQQLLRAEVQRPHVDDRVDRVVADQRGLDPARTSSAVRALAEQQALGLERQDDRDSDQQHADRDRADAVPAPLSVISVRPTPNSARTRPTSAAKSSSSTTGSSGALACRTNCTQRLVAAHVVGLVRSRSGTRTTPGRSRPPAPRSDPLPGVDRRAGRWSLWQPS